MRPTLTITKGEGGLGRPLPGEDHISGIVYYAASLPAGFGSLKEKTITSLKQAQDLGIIESSATFDVLWYHIREFFRINPLGILHVGIYPVPGGTYDFAEVVTLQRYALGKIRQVAVYTKIVGISSVTCAALNTKCATLEDEGMPLVALLACDISGTADITTLSDLRTAGASPNVAVVIGQDGAAKGAALYVAETDSITCLGAALGLLSAIPVSANMGWVKQYNVADGELATPAFANGQLCSALSASALDALHDKGYLFLRTYQGRAGTFFNDSPTIMVPTSDYAYIEAVRTIQKAVRQVRAFFTEAINGPVPVDAETGFLAESYVEYLKSLGDRALAEMANAGELSGYQTLINPEQNVLSTSQIDVTIELVPIGVARKIVITIGYKTQLS